jgi:Icc protein
MLRIAHISDIHIDTSSNPNDLGELRTLIEKIAALKYDHILMTGDITDVPNLSDLLGVRSILEDTGFYNWERLTILPGNHDVFGKYGERKARQQLSLNPDMVPRLSRKKNYEEKINAFCNVFQKAFVAEDSAVDNFFPFVKIIGNVAIVGFNTVMEWSVISNPIGSRGRIDAEELAMIDQPEIAQMLSGKTVIAVMHHAYTLYEPGTTLDKAFVWGMELVDKEATLKTLQHIHTKLVLHGHFHRAEIYREGGIVFVNCGSTKRTSNKINSVTVDDEGNITQEFLKL